MECGIILLVEDNPGDVRLITEALHENGIYGVLSVVSDGVEAMKYLRREGSYRDVPAPDLVLLDLNIPKKDGFEVLQEMRADARLSSIPVVVLSGSNNEEHISWTYDLRANSYVTKPAQFDDFVSVVRMIVEYWFGLAKLPGKAGAPPRPDRRAGVMEAPPAHPGSRQSRTSPSPRLRLAPARSPRGAQAGQP